MENNVKDIFGDTYIIISYNQKLRKHKLKKLNEKYSI